MSIIKPRHIEPGCTIGLVAPSGPAVRSKDTPPGTMPDHLQKGIDYLHHLGYKVKVGKNALNRRGYLAGTDQERLHDFHTFISDPAIDAVFCLAGGYGTPRLLPDLDMDLIHNNPKIIEGYSDITALLTSIHDHTGLVTFHGPMANWDFGRDIDYNREGLWNVMSKTLPHGPLSIPENFTKPQTIIPGVVSGKLVGGNLSLLVTTLGTPWEINTENCILFIEDVEEAPYRFDRMMNQLRLAGKLEQAKGFIIGECVNCIPSSEDSPSLTLEEVLDDYLLPLNKPCIYPYPCGHGTYKVTLPLGINCTLDATQAVLSLDESAVL